MSELALARPFFRALPFARIVGLAASLLFLVAVVSRSVRAFSAPGSEMDEGDPLVYGERVLGGDLPWRHFETFYGPANPYLVALAFRLLGVSVFAERMVGMTFRLVLCAALLSLAWRFGLAGLLSSGLVLLILVPAGEIWAWPGSEAVAAIALTVALLAAAQARDSRALARAAGVAAGATMLIRFDYAPAVVLAALPFLWGGGISRKRFALGAAVTAGLYLPLLAAAGPSRILQVAGDISRGTAGRKLPLPDLTSYPGNLLAASVVASVVLVVAGTLLRSRVSLAVGLASLATLPHTLGRPDEVHILAGCVLSLVLLPAVLVALVRHLEARSRVSAAVVLVAIAAGGFGVARAQASGNLGPLLNTLTMRGANVEHGGRSFPLADRDTRRDIQRIVDAAGAAAPAGSKLFVGPRDLRRTNYADTYLYFLLPEFEPASFYIELEPGTLNNTGKRAVTELARADLLILTSRHDDWREPNRSRRFGSSAPNRYVASHFCPRARSGTYTLLVRWQQSGRSKNRLCGSEPQTVQLRQSTGTTLMERSGFDCHNFRDSGSEPQSSTGPTRAMATRDRAQDRGAAASSMRASMNAMSAEPLQALLERAFPEATELSVVDRTGGGDHFQVTVTSPRFDALPLIDQHRLVNAALAEPLLDGTIHELRIKTRGTG